MPEGVRIQKVLADAGVASRRAADALVAAGRVSVDGRPALVGERIDPGRASVSVDGVPLTRPVGHRYLVMHKPRGVTSTVADRHARRTVLDLVPAELRGPGRLYPVGRLDLDSEGLLLLTDDGDWAQGVLHPSFGVEREYAVGLAGPLGDDQARRLADGLPLDEGLARLGLLRPASAAESARLEALIGARAGELTWYRAVLGQGWKRQLRRMFAAVGAPVRRLVRVRLGGLRLGDLPPGGVRELRRAERDRLGGRHAMPAAEAEPRSSAAASGRRGPTARRPGNPRRLGPLVTIDGPASSGKSSVGAAAAARLGCRFLDTGLLYRALAWLALDRGIALEDVTTLVDLAGEIELLPDAQGRIGRVRVGGREVTERLHRADVDRAVSVVAREPAVRARLLPIQRALTAEGGIIVAGRDIGTVVLPDAEVKVYLDVSPEERARRRALERGLDPGSPEAAVILDDLRRRDRIDSTREAAPLRVPEGASTVRSDGLTFEETVDAVVRLVRRQGGAGKARSRGERG